LQNLLVKFKAPDPTEEALFIGDLNVQTMKKNMEYEFLLNKAYLIIKKLPDSEEVNTWLNNYEQS
jgi:hypothetical protein